MSTDRGAPAAKLIQAGDAVILAAALLLTLAAALALWLPGAAGGDTVTVTVGGSVYGVYPLDQNAVVDTGHNRIVIQNGTVRMERADCPDKLCVQQGALAHVGVIVCLPNRVVVRVGMESAAEYDAVVGRLESGAGQ